MVKHHRVNYINHVVNRADWPLKGLNRGVSTKAKMMQGYIRHPIREKRLLARIGKGNAIWREEIRHGNRLNLAPGAGTALADFTHEIIRLRYAIKMTLRVSQGKCRERFPIQPNMPC
ncbi:MAG: hypothetical protein DYG98_20265 [Haliscomenobacteraceae bacterium CHB4]|nr:hypothetical protein [Haliscomenobacteraceae bacterium CHB4]